MGTPPHLSSRASKHPRTVIVRFQNYQDREKVWKASWTFRSNRIYVKEDFTQAMRNRRNILLPVLKAAKRDPKTKRCTLRGDKLILDGVKYTAEDFDSIPERLKWTVKGERYFEQCDSTFFFGKDSFLSNHHPSPFRDNDSTYLCAEQFYLRQKCLYFEDMETAQRIMRTSDPGRMKAFSHHIKGLDEIKWRSQAKNVMEKACHLKFSQNEVLKQKLLSSRGALVEANGRDKYFSCGLSLANPSILETSKWEGENILGQVLTSLREVLKN